MRSTKRSHPSRILTFAEKHRTEEAIEKAQALHPDLIVMDLSMPVMNGIDATRALKALMPSVPVIIFSEYSDVFSQGAMLVKQCEPDASEYENPRFKEPSKKNAAGSTSGVREESIIASAGNAVWRSHESHARLADGMDDSRIVFLQYLRETPAMAGCAQCRLKFFTPSELLEKPREATDYLWGKFAAHTCKWEEAVPNDHPRCLRFVTANIGICEACETRFVASAYLRDHPREAESDVRRKFARHACSRSHAA